MQVGAESRKWFERAQAVLPGGVCSPVRAYGSVGGTPPVIAHARGTTVTDVDGNDYLDFVCSWGPLVLGHAHAKVVAALETAVRHGTSFGAPCVPEIELAERVVASYPGAEQVRFVSSGTEAVMSAVRVARGATGRDLIVKFAGCYHGHADYLLVAAGSGLATLGLPSSAGVPEDFAKLTRVLPLDDEAALERLFAEEGERIAAVVVEPVPANTGLLIQRREFLEALRAQCTRHGALLVFDEVITGFRLGPGGAAGHYGITPDLATFGKVIGGGLPVGAFAGSRALMRELAPEGRVYQAGTLSGNPIAMTAGLETLRVLEAENGWQRLDALGAHVEHRIGAALVDAPVPVTLARIGSIFWLAWFASEPPRTAEALDARSSAAYAQLFHALAERGVAIAPSAFEVGFVSLAHTEAEIDRLAKAVGEAFADPRLWRNLDAAQA